MQIRIDFDKKIGNVKPFHAINNAPLLGTDNKLFHYLSDAHVPYSRLHDTGGAYGGFRYVDIENIFRDFNADESDPDSYDFAFTDWLLTELVNAGSEPFFRLGATIENSQHIKAYHIYPPKDCLKWAKICEGIINHYNHGWADGFNYNITYWEIWNEPDNMPKIEDNPMWKGTKEEYFRLYEVASNYLKQKFPYIRIGGYASCGFYAVDKNFSKIANSSPRTEYFVDFFHEFLQYISSAEHKSPLDFFSWHSYADSKSNSFYCDYARSQLDKYGFTEAESILNEWNPGIHRRGSEEDACYILEMMLTLHKKKLDMLMYYDGQVHGSYQGLFDPLKLDIFPAYFAVHSFGEIVELGTEVFADGDLPLIVARKDDTAKLLTVNINKTLNIEPILSDEWSVVSYRILDGVNGLISTPFESRNSFVLPENKIVMLEFKKEV